MPQLEINLTIEYETDADLQRLAELLRVADSALTDYAQQQIKWHDDLEKELDRVLPGPDRTNAYRQHIREHFLAWRAWVDARDRGKRIVGGAYYQVVQLLQKGKGE